MTLGVLALTTVGLDTRPWSVAGMGTIVGIGIGFAMQTSILAVQNAVDLADMGMGTSTALLARTLGGTVGTPLLGAVLAAGLPAHGATAAQYADALPWVFAAAVPVGLLAILFGFLLPQRGRARHRGDRHGRRAGLTLGRRQDQAPRPPRGGRRRRRSASAPSSAPGARRVSIPSSVSTAERAGSGGPTARRPTPGRSADSLGERRELVAERDGGLPRGARRHHPRGQTDAATPRRRRPPGP